mmetsp:Transcript_27288/g.37816  ORF Transcript_27288/g.37816 Transcript_27288/m.37816 type:complete len:362 (+) Transcript_27288:244-1329(+)
MINSGIVEGAPRCGPNYGSNTLLKRKNEEPYMIRTSKVARTSSAIIPHSSQITSMATNGTRGSISSLSLSSSSVNVGNQPSVTSSTLHQGFSTQPRLDSRISSSYSSSSSSSDLSWNWIPPQQSNYRPHSYVLQRPAFGVANRKKETKAANIRSSIQVASSSTSIMSSSSEDEDVPICPPGYRSLRSFNGKGRRSNCRGRNETKKMKTAKGSKRKIKKKRRRKRKPPPPTFNFSPSQLEQLPVQLHRKIITFMYPLDVAALCVVSKRMDLYLKDGYIWKHLSRRIWHGRCPQSCARKHDWRIIYRTRMKEFRRGKIYLCQYCTCSYAFKSKESLENHNKLHELNPSTGREYLMKNSCPIPG